MGLLDMFSTASFHHVSLACQKLHFACLSSVKNGCYFIGSFGGIHCSRLISVLLIKNYQHYGLVLSLLALW